MSRTQGEGRSSGERGQRVVTTAAARRAAKARRAEEEREWAARSGPVVARKAES